MVLSVEQSGIPCFLIIVATRGNNNVALIWTVLGMCFILIFSMVSQLHFNVSVCHPLQDSLFCLSAAIAEAAAKRGEADKGYHYEAVVWAVGDILFLWWWSV